MDDTQKKWLYALSSPMVTLNIKAGANYSEDKLWINGKPNDAKEFFEGSWDIKNREDLIHTVINMADRGHAESLGVDFYYWPQKLPSEKQSLTKHPAQDIKDAHLNFVESSSFLTDGGGIKAWDLVRLCFLVRNAVDAKYLTLEEALFLTSRLGKRAQYWYSSWSAYFSGYLLGRLLWTSQEFDDYKNRDESLNGSKGLWVEDQLYRILYASDNPALALDWYTPCPDLKPPATLIGVNL